MPVKAGRGAATVSSADADWPPVLVAVIVAVPADTPVAEQLDPFTDAVAVPELELVQLASVGVGEPPLIDTAKLVLAPTVTVAVLGAIEIVTGVGGTVMMPPSPPPPQAASISAASTPEDRNPRMPRLMATPR
jgi:hypothetical protein